MFRARVSMLWARLPETPAARRSRRGQPQVITRIDVQGREASIHFLRVYVSPWKLQKCADTSVEMLLANSDGGFLMRTNRFFSSLLVATLAACSGVAPTGDPVESAVKPKPAPVPVSDNPYTLFEALQTRPLALSPSGKFLFALNTPDGRLEIFRVKKHGLDAVASVPVGLEPVSLAARSEDEVWVVNHLSDSVSIVDVSKPQDAQVVRTLLVGDEPRD